MIGTLIYLLIDSMVGCFWGFISRPCNGEKNVFLKLDFQFLNKLILNIKFIHVALIVQNIKSEAEFFSSQ